MNRSDLSNCAWRGRVQTVQRAGAMALAVLLGAATCRAQVCQPYWATAGGAPGAPMLHTVYTLTNFDDGSGPALYVGGAFGVVGIPALPPIWRRHNGPWEPVGSGLPGHCSSLIVLQSGGIESLYAY